MCIPEQIEGVSTPEEASGQGKWKTVNKRLAFASRHTREHVHSALDSLRFWNCHKDPSGAALQIVKYVRAAAIKSNKSSVVIDTGMCESLIAKFCKHIVAFGAHRAHQKLPWMLEHGTQSKSFPLPSHYMCSLCGVCAFMSIAFTRDGTVFSHEVAVQRSFKMPLIVHLGSIGDHKNKNDIQDLAACARHWVVDFYYDPNRAKTAESCLALHPSHLNRTTSTACCLAPSPLPNRTATATSCLAQPPSPSRTTTPTL